MEKDTLIFEKLLCKLTGAEAAMAVNNNAAAVMLILSSMAKGGEVVVSRGELVEIGGKFRIPDVMEQSGASLVEVGTTNKTHYSDYEEAITEETKALLKVHTSNYRIVGFTETVTIDELIPIAQEHDIPIIEDLGSGVLICGHRLPDMNYLDLAECMPRDFEMLLLASARVICEVPPSILLVRNAE